MIFVILSNSSLSTGSSLIGVIREREVEPSHLDHNKLENIAKTHPNIITYEKIKIA